MEQERPGSGNCRGLCEEEQLERFGASSNSGDEREEDRKPPEQKQGENPWAAFRRRQRSDETDNEKRE